MNTSNSSFIRKPSVRGFTLVELLIVVALIGILAGVGIPSVKSLIRSIQLSSASNDLLAGFLMARSEAIKRHSRVVICKSSDGASCAASGGWEQGWMVFQDANNDGSRDVGEAIVQHQQALPPELRVTGNQNVARYVSYTANGESRLVGGGFQAGTITLCRSSANAVEARQIILSAGGRPRVQKTQVGMCG